MDGAPLKALNLTPDDVIAGWLADSRGLIVRTQAPPFKASRFDVVSGQRTPVGTIAPGDASGISFTGVILFAPDGDHYVYGFSRLLGDLFVIDGLK